MNKSKQLDIRNLLLPLLAWCTLAGADHKPDADWSWHVMSAGADESRLSVYRRDRLLGIYNLSCDLSDASEGSHGGNGASLARVRPVSKPEGSLGVGCNGGAHSRQFTIFDLVEPLNTAMFSATGRCRAGWDLQDGELWRRCAQPCDGGLSVECPDGYETWFVTYPDAGSATID